MAYSKSKSDGPFEEFISDEKLKKIFGEKMKIAGWAFSYQIGTEKLLHLTGIYLLKTIRGKTSLHNLCYGEFSSIKEMLKCGVYCTITCFHLKIHSLK